MLKVPRAAIPGGDAGGDDGRVGLVVDDDAAAGDRQKGDAVSGGRLDLGAFQPNAHFPDSGRTGSTFVPL